MKLSGDMLIDLLINIASIVVLFLIVRKLVYKPVKKFMTARSERVAGAEEEANRRAAEAAAQKEEYEQKLAALETDKQQAVRESEEAARAAAQKILAAAQEKADSIVNGAQKKGQEAYDKRLEAGQDEIIDLSVDISSKLLARNISDDDNRRLAEEFLASLKGERHA